MIRKSQANSLSRLLVCLIATTRCVSSLVFHACCISLGLSLCGAEVSPSADTTIASAFTATTIQLKVAPQATQIDAEWQYTNRWDFPLLIERVDQSCSCLSSTHDAEKATPIAPGATGTLRASFTPGNHRGLLRKSLHVRFVGHEKPVELVAEVNIPNVIELSKRDLCWSSDDLNSTTVDVTTAKEIPFQITGLLGLPEENFSIKQDVVVPGKHYRISVTPLKKLDSVHCLQVRTDSADPRDQVIAVFLSQKISTVRQPKP